MSVDFFIFAVLLLVNAVMALAMLLAARTLGQPRTTYLLAGAFAGNVLLYVTDAIYYFLYRGNVWADMGVSAVAMTPPIFAALAYRHRSGLDYRLRPIAASYALALATILWFGLVQPDRSVRAAVVPLYAGGMLLFAMRAVLRPGRRLQTSERPILLTTAAMAAVEIAGGIVQFFKHEGAAPLLDQLYVLIVFLALPGLTVSAGIFSLYLLASDLAERLRVVAATDSLTGAPNRRAIEETGMRMIEEARAGQRPLAIAICDVDHFKEINDECGHDHGDEVLRRLAALFRERLARPDHFGRFGGEEFVLFFPDCDVETARDRVEALRRDIMAIRIEGEIDGETTGLTASFGIAPMTGADQNLADILKRADLALYVSKETGRNRTTIDYQARARLERA